MKWKNWKEKQMYPVKRVNGTDRCVQNNALKTGILGVLVWTSSEITEFDPTPEPDGVYKTRTLNFVEEKS